MKQTEVRTRRSRPGRIVSVVLELAAVAVVGTVLFLALSGPHPVEAPLGRLVLERGLADTGARNLVTSIYLGYRAFDTLGEAVVLVQAVAGVMFFVGRRREPGAGPTGGEGPPENAGPAGGKG